MISPRFWIASSDWSGRHRLALRAAVITGAVVAPLLLLTWFLQNPGFDPELETPIQHFVIVGGVSLVALTVAVLLVVGAMRTAAYRVLFLSIGFMAMAGLFLIHAISTPGVLVSNAGDVYGTRTVVRLSAFLSVAIPSGFFAASYTPLPVLLERRLPFLPVGWLSLVVASLLLIFAGLAFGDQALISGLPLASPPWANIFAEGSVLLLAFAAWRQARMYLISRLPLQAALALAFIFLAEAQVAMVVTSVWTLAWWLYHLLMFAAVVLAFRALTIEIVSGRPLRTIVNQALQLGLDVAVDDEFVDSIAALSTAIELKDGSVRGHNRRVAGYAVAIGRELGMTNQAIRIMARAALLHDIGKLGISDAILLKQGPLSESEWTLVKRHPTMGLDILATVGHLQQESEIITAHHERIDGSGYPKGLVGDEIPMGARIIAVADTYDVLMSDRPYRTARSAAVTQQTLVAEAGHHLYRPAVEALVRLVDAVEAQTSTAGRSSRSEA